MSLRQRISWMLIFIFAVIAQCGVISTAIASENIDCPECQPVQSKIKVENPCKTHSLMTIKKGAQYGFHIEDCDLGPEDCTNLEPWLVLTKGGNFITSVTEKDDRSTILKLNPAAKTVSTFPLEQIQTTDKEMVRAVDIQINANEIKIFYGTDFDHEKQAFKKFKSVVLDESLNVLRAARKEEHLVKKDRNFVQLDCQLPFDIIGRPHKLRNHYYFFKIFDRSTQSFQLVKIQP